MPESCRDILSSNHFFLVKLGVIVDWLGVGVGNSVFLWFSAVTRVGKVQFVSRKLKMNSGVQIQRMRKPPVFSAGDNLIKCQWRTACGG